MTCPHCGAEIKLTHKMQTLQAQYVAHAWTAHRIAKAQALRELRGASRNPTAKDALPILSTLRSAGLKPKLIGSVAKQGHSAHDIDIALQFRTHGAEANDPMEYPEYAKYHKAMEGMGFRQTGEDLDYGVEEWKKGTLVVDVFPEALENPRSTRPAFNGNQTAKEPWQMTFDEYRTSLKGKRIEHSYYNREGQIQYDWLVGVETAVQLGKPVPGKVFESVRRSFRHKLEEWRRLYKDVPSAKEPWEMPKDEWRTARLAAGKAELSALKAPPASPLQKTFLWGAPERIRLEYGAEPTVTRGFPIVEHAEVIRKALREGRPIPPNVLADYPELKRNPRAEAAKPAAAPAQASKEPWMMTRAEWNKFHFNEAEHRYLPDDYFGEWKLTQDRAKTMPIRKLPNGIELRKDAYDIAWAFDGEKAVGMADGKAIHVAPAYQKKGIGLELMRATIGDKPAGSRTSAGVSLFNAYHRDAVRKALASGKPVPSEVLADYPALAAKAKALTAEAARAKNPLKNNASPLVLLGLAGLAVWALWKARPTQ